MVIVSDTFRHILSMRIVACVCSDTYVRTYINLSAFQTLWKTERVSSNVNLTLLCSCLLLLAVMENWNFDHNSVISGHFSFISVSIPTFVGTMNNLLFIHSQHIPFIQINFHSCDNFFYQSAFSFKMLPISAITGKQKTLL